MRKINLFLMAVLVAFVSFAKVSAQTAIEGSPADIDFSTNGNYVLFTDDENIKVLKMPITSDTNNDQPFGYYYYDVNKGQYVKFSKFDKTKAGKDGWCQKTDEYMYICDDGDCHPLKNMAPTIMFTAPADGYYKVGITVYRPNPNPKVINPLYIRARMVTEFNSVLSCPKDEEMFSKQYGHVETDGMQGKAPVDLDFFVHLKEGDRIAADIDAYTSNNIASAGTQFTRFVVARMLSDGNPITKEFVDNADFPCYDPRAQKVVEPKEGKMAIRVVGTERYLVKKEKANDKYFYGAIFAPNDITTEANKKNIPLSDFDWEYDIVKNTNGGYNIKFGGDYMVSDGYIDKTASADKNRFTFYTPEHFKSGIAIKREADGKYWKDNMRWVSPYNKIDTSTDPVYVFELVEAPAATPYAFFNFDMAETAIDNLKAVANRNGYTVNVNLTRSLSNQYWNTFCVPFDISVEKVTDIFGTGTLITEFTGVEGTTMMLTETNTIAAGKPYLVKPANTVVNPLFTDVKITEAAPQTVTFGDYSFTGVYGPTTIKTDGTDLFVTSTGGLSKPADNTKNTIKGMRAYITVPSGTAAKLSIMGTTTSVEQIAVGNGNDTDKVYNINGQLIDGKAKGIVVKKGKKFVAK